MTDSPLPWRPSVGIVLINQDKCVFIGKRIVHDSRQLSHPWQMPQGGIDDDEEPHEAAMRELLEETGVRHADILAEARHWHYYDFPAQVHQKWAQRYRGQRQRWFAMGFAGDDSDININYDSSPEFSAWQWASADTVLQRAASFRTPIYGAVLEEFAPYLR